MFANDSTAYQNLRAPASHAEAFMAPGLTLFISPVDNLAIGTDFGWLISGANEPIFIALTIKFEFDLFKHLLSRRTVQAGKQDAAECRRLLG